MDEVSKGSTMSKIDKDELLRRIEISKRNLLKLSEQLIIEIDDLESIHLELAMTRSKDESDK